MLASGFGSGFVPLSPGSAGSLLALLPGAWMLIFPGYVLGCAALAATVIGVWSIRAAAPDEDDPGWVVIDEIAGQWIALMGLASPTWPGLLAAFLIFRLLDIAKPGPVGWADRQRGAAAVMADDIIAGALTAGILWAARSRWPGLFDA